MTGAPAGDMDPAAKPNSRVRSPNWVRFDRNFQSKRRMNEMKRLNGTEELDRKIELQKVTNNTLRQEAEATEVEIARLRVAQKDQSYAALTSGDAQAKAQ